MQEEELEDIHTVWNRTNSVTMGIKIDARRELHREICIDPLIITPTFSHPAKTQSVISQAL